MLTSANATRCSVPQQQKFHKASLRARPLVTAIRRLFERMATQKRPPPEFDYRPNEALTRASPEAFVMVSERFVPLPLSVESDQESPVLSTGQ